MTQDDIIRMAREASIIADEHASLYLPPKYLEHFAALVAAARDKEHAERMRYDIHSCGPTCQRYACIATREAVAAEREACAKLCDELHWPWHMGDNSGPKECAVAIRARGQA